MADERKIKLTELRENKTGRSCWVAIHDKVYDVTKFLEDHPGGEEVLLEQAGSYATEAFEDVGHSTDARELMQKYQIGVMSEEDEEKEKPAGGAHEYTPIERGNSSIMSWLVPLGAAIVAAVIYKVFAGTS